MSVKLTEEQESLKKMLTRLRNLQADATSELYTLAARCTHVYEKVYESAKCAICENEAGWWCPVSADHVCDYSQEDGSYDEDQCRYCGQPEERK